jgi:hypothetical protein
MAATATEDSGAELSWQGSKSVLGLIPAVIVEFDSLRDRFSFFSWSH